MQEEAFIKAIVQAGSFKSALANVTSPSGVEAGFTASQAPSPTSVSAGSQARDADTRPGTALLALQSPARQAELEADVGAGLVTLYSWELANTVADLDADLKKRVAAAEKAKSTRKGGAAAASAAGGLGAVCVCIRRLVCVFDNC